VRHIHTLLHRALRQAVRLGLLDSNPADAVDAPRQARPERVILNAPQLGRLIALSEGNRLFIPILLATTTGMRAGEVLGLQWRDIDLGAGLLRVQRSAEDTREGVRLKQTKTKAGKGVISLPELTIAHLREASRQRGRVRGWSSGKEFVYPDKYGGPMPVSQLSSRFAAFMRSTDLPKVTFHGLRHSHASMLADAGFTSKDIADRLGHSTVSVAGDLYSHLNEGRRRETADAVDAALQGTRHQVGTGRLSPAEE
jgi:integrase